MKQAQSLITYYKKKMSLLFCSNKEAVGLYIGKENIFLTYLKKGKPNSIGSFSSLIAKTPQGVIDNGVIIDKKKISQIIKKLIMDNKITAGRAFVVLSKPDVVTRIVTLPLISKEHIREVLQQEVDKYIVFGGEETLIDWHRIDSGKVLLVAIKKSIATSIVDAVEGGGLSVGAIEVLSLSLIRLILSSEKDFYSDKVVMVVIISQEATDIAVIKNGSFSFFHSFGETEPLNFIREVEMASTYWSEQSPSSPIEKIVAFADSDKVKDTYKKFSKKIGLEILDGSSAISSLLKGKTAENKYICTQGATVGLALRGIQKKSLFAINLVPPEKIKADIIKRGFFLAFAFLSSAFFILLILNLIFTGMFGSYKKKLLPIKQKLEDSEDVLLKIKEINAKKDSYQRRLKERTDFIKHLNAISWVEIIEEIRRFMPHEVWLESIDTKDSNTIYLNGEAYSQDVVYKYVNLLEYSDYFYEPSLTEIDQQGAGERVVFSISCPLRIFGKDKDED